MAEEQNVKRYSFLKGIFAGVMVTIAMLMIVFVSVYELGYVNIGTNGEIYVQDKSTAGNSSEGIGTAVSDKLNVLEQVLNSFYFDDVDANQVADQIYKAYLNAFGDKYTVYYTPEEYQSITQSTQGKYCGIGVVVSKNEDGTIRVVNPYDNAPGSKAGMKAGDAITKVDGISVIDRDLSSVVAEMKGDAGTSVELELIREGVAEPFTVTIVREEIEVQTIDYEMMSDGIGYISISEFDEVTTSQFMNAYKTLKAQNMKGLVVDVRSNPGGLLTTVNDILDELLPSGIIVYTEDKNGKRTEYRGKDADELEVPMAVLINEDSASAAEIFAGAVQDYEVGTLVGTTTFGKGIVQTIRPLTDGSAVKYTVAKYFTPKGQDIHGKGLTPDVVIEYDSSVFQNSEYSKEKDNQLNKAIETVKNQIK